MEKEYSYDVIIPKVQTFAVLKPEDQEREKSTLEAKKTARATMMSTMKKEIEDLEAKSEETVRQRAVISKKIQGLALKIPTMLAFGQDTSGVISQESELSKLDAILSRTVDGLRRRVEDLRCEEKLLQEEQDQDDFWFKVYRCVPLPERANRALKEYVKVLEEIMDAVDSLDFSFHPLSSRTRIIYPSDWSLVERVPKFFLVGDEGSEDKRSGGGLRDLWSKSEWREKRRR